MAIEDSVEGISTTKKGGSIGFGGWVSIIFLGFVLLVHAINGARYVFDDEYREKGLPRKPERSAKHLSRRCRKTDCAGSSTDATFLEPAMR
jgi:hypothetical protein